jgi:hypothetical protein
MTEAPFGIDPDTGLPTRHAARVLLVDEQQRMIGRRT